jgi:hypothetical protein
MWQWLSTSADPSSATLLTLDRSVAQLGRSVAQDVTWNSCMSARR